MNYETDLLNFERHCLSLESAWRSESEPDLGAFIDSIDGEISKSCLLELVKIDFEHRLKKSTDTSINFYWKQFPRISELNDKIDLLKYELALRKRLGKSLSQIQLEQRFDSEDIQLLAQISTVIETAEKTLVSDDGIGEYGTWEDIVQIGTQINQYTLEERIGSGAFAIVYKATDHRLRRRVAMKFLRPGLMMRADARKRMLLEAQAVSSFQHNHIVNVFEIGRYKMRDFIVSRFVDGQTLDQILHQQRFSITDAVRIIGQLADAVHHAHSQGVIHRDIKPANIMIENDQPCLLDFGLAHFSDASVHLTNAGEVVGTPAYMAPEQADGRAWQSDPRTDVYGLGTLLYQLTSHQLPFTGTTADVIHQVINNDPVSPRKLNAAIDADLETIILKSLEKDPQDRYQSAEALNKDLNRYLIGEPIIARPMGVLGRTFKWSKRRPLVAAMSALLIVATAFLIGMGSQIIQVSRQRDKAQTARVETQSAKNQLQQQMAIESADSGILAMQRGRMSEAIELFDRSLKFQLPNAIDIRFRKLESLVVIGNLDAANQELKTIHQIVDESKNPDHYDVGRVHLWQAELAMDGIGHKDPTALFEQARQIDLPIATLHHVDGMLATTSNDAVKFFRLAVENDTFKYLPRRMLITMLISLGRFEESLTEIKIARELFPENLDFDLFRAIALAATNRMDECEACLNDADIELDRQKWNLLCNDIRWISNELVAIPGAVGYSSLDIEDLQNNFQSKHIELIRSRRWHLPPLIADVFVDNFQSLVDSLLNDANPLTSLKSLKALIDVHAEGTLYALYGERLATYYNLMLTDSDDYDRLAEFIQDALAAFRQSQSLPAWINSIDVNNRIGILGASLSLFHRHEIDIKTNQALFIESSRRLDPALVGSASSLRAVAVALITLESYDEAVPWCDRWIEVVGPKNLDAVWHRAVLDRWRLRWLDVLHQSDKALKDHPNYKPLQGLRERAIKELKKQVNLDSD